MESILSEVKISLELSSSDKDELLSSLIKRSVRPVLNYIEEDYLPEELQYIVVEVVLARYNKLGSEGISSESVDGISYTYDNNLIKPYHKDLDRWINKHSQNTKSKVTARLI